MSKLTDTMGQKFDAVLGWAENDFEDSVFIFLLRLLLLSVGALLVMGSIIWLTIIGVDKAFGTNLEHKGEHCTQHVTTVTVVSTGKSTTVIPVVSCARWVKDVPAAN